MADQSREALTSIVDSIASRRRILGGLVGGTVAGLLGWQTSDADRKRRKSGRDRRRSQQDNSARVSTQGKSDDGPATLKVMTRNIYFGADLVPVFEVESFEGLLEAVATIFELVEATNFPERAKALAKEIATFNPHLVGLQEVALWRSGPAGPDPAQTVEYDFLAILLDELAKRGKSYEAVAAIQNADAEAPRIGPAGLEDIRFTDRDVILARTDLPAKKFAVTDTHSDNFANPLTLEIGDLGIVIPIPRGWTAVDVTLDGRAMRVVNTHLEPLDPGRQVAQGNELLAGPLATELPVVLVGDLNTVAESSGPVPPGLDTPTYDNLLAAGFVDAAAAKKDRKGKKPDFTCCQDEDLANKTSNLTMRIDFVLTRGGFKAAAVKVIGNKRGDKTPSGLWPSDHAGVTAVLHLKQS
jgi:endonuclease/exonuclease/phosphatase family metal-dependent hydrolase